MNHVGQQAGYRLLLIANILDNLSRAGGEAPIAPEIVIDHSNALYFGEPGCCAVILGLPN